MLAYSLEHTWHAFEIGQGGIFVGSEKLSGFCGLAGIMKFNFSCIGMVCLLLLEVFAQNPRSAVAE